MNRVNKETGFNKGWFKKNHSVSDELRKKVSLNNKTRILSEETHKKLSQRPQCKIPYIRTEEQKQKLRMLRLGKPSPKKGKKVSLEALYNITIAQKKRFENKENHPRWIKDKSKLVSLLHSEERKNILYNRWRNSVLNRDGKICRMKNIDCKGKLEVHHILNWRDYVELRYEINNGITLCHTHHPRGRVNEKRLSPYFQELVSVSKE